MAFLVRTFGIAAVSGLVGALSGCGARGTLLDEYGPGGAGGGGGDGGSTTSSSTITTSSSTTTSSTTTTTTTTSMGSGTVISGSVDSMYEGETTVVATADGTVAAAWIAVSDQGTPYIAYAFSPNDGVTWQAPIALPSPDGRFGSDPVLATDSFGNLYLTWVGFKAPGGNVSDMQVYVATSKPGTFAFGPPMLVSDPNEPTSTFLDKPWITVTAKDSVIVSYARFADDFSIITGRSTDFGQSFTRTVVIQDEALTTFYNLAYLCVSKETGRLFTTYQAIQQFGQDLSIKTMLSWSDDDGVSFPAGNFSVVSAGELDVAFGDPTCTARGSDLFVTYHLSKDPLSGESEASQKAYSVIVRHSGNGGVSFDGLMDAGDVMTAPFFMLSDVKHEDTGMLDVVYYAGSMDDDPAASFRRARFSYGAVNQPPSDLVESPVVMTPDRGVPYWLGDYIGHYIRGKREYVTYVVNADYTSHVAFQRLDLP